MQQIITLLHILVSICIIGLILVQRGKGADAGAGFAGGGSSNSMFGSQGSTPFLVKLTGGLAIVFFITSSVLSLIVGRQLAQHNPLPVPASQTQEIPTSINTEQGTAAKAPPLGGTTTQSPMPANKTQ
jgi:preprotein translocase subunit SecG